MDSNANRLVSNSSRRTVTTIPGRPDIVQQTMPLRMNGLQGVNRNFTTPVQIQPSIRRATNLQTTPMQMQNSFELTRVSHAIRNNLIHKDGQDNTALAYDSKIIEFKQYCHAKHYNPPITELVTIPKAYGFIVYNCYCPKSTTRKKRGDSNVARFSLADYVEVCSVVYMI